MRLDRFWMLLSADVLLLVLGGRRWIECWHIASIDTKKLIFDWQMVYHEVATITKTIDPTRNRRIKYSNIISTDQIDFFQVLMQPSTSNCRIIKSWLALLLRLRKRKRQKSEWNNDISAMDKTTHNCSITHDELQYTIYQYKTKKNNTIQYKIK